MRHDLRVRKDAPVAPVPEVREEPVERTRQGADVLPRPPVELRRLDDLLPDLLTAPVLVEDLVGAVEERAVHVALFQILVDVDDRVRPLGLSVDPLQDLQMGLDGIAGEEFVEEPAVAMVLARIRGEGDIHVPHAGLALEGLKTPAEEPGKGAHIRRRSGRRWSPGSSRRG